MYARDLVIPVDVWRTCVFDMIGNYRHPGSPSLTTIDAHHCRSRPNLGIFSLWMQMNDTVCTWRCEDCRKLLYQVSPGGFEMKVSRATRIRICGVTPSSFRERRETDQFFGVIATSSTKTSENELMACRKDRYQRTVGTVPNDTAP